MPTKLAEELAQKAYITYLDDVQLTDGLQSGSISSCVLITCAEMGFRLPFVGCTPRSNLFIFQNFGHRIMDSGVIDFIKKTGTSELIVYGHTDCEFARFLTQAEQHPTSGKEFVEKHCQEENDFITRKYGSYPNMQNPDNLLNISEWRILNELRSLLACPEILRLADKGSLNLHGWIYSESRNVLEVFSPETKRFTLPRLRDKMQA